MNVMIKKKSTMPQLRQLRRFNDLMRPYMILVSYRRNPIFIDGMFWVVANPSWHRLLGGSAVDSSALGESSSVDPRAWELRCSPLQDAFGPSLFCLENVRSFCCHKYAFCTETTFRFASVSWLLRWSTGPGFRKEILAEASLHLTVGPLLNLILQPNCR